ncbi:helix-turn-helix domain-containing protein [Myxococcota bacterium]|nr:helix-turn-helix domain-containing protein [Myxococcota bacterium]
MKLKDYLKKNQITLQQFADKLGVSCSTVGHYVAGRRTPSIAMARRIEQATNFDVLMWDFAPEHNEVPPTSEETSIQRTPACTTYVIQPNCSER